MLKCNSAWNAFGAQSQVCKSSRHMTELHSFRKIKINIPITIITDMTLTWDTDVSCRPCDIKVFSLEQFLMFMSNFSGLWSRSESSSCWDVESLTPSQCLPSFQYCVNKISLTAHHSSLHHVSHISQADKITPDLLPGGSWPDQWLAGVVCRVYFRAPHKPPSSYWFRWRDVIEFLWFCWKSFYYFRQHQNEGGWWSDSHLVRGGVWERCECCRGILKLGASDLVKMWRWKVEAEVNL